MRFDLSPKTTMILFGSMVAFVVMQATWWIVLMARLLDEKVDIARRLGASPEAVEELQAEETSRQIMLGLEGVVFLLLLLVGIWLIYRTLLRTEQLKLRQQNFLMAVTHELKTPLASIKLYLDSMLSPKITPEKKQAVIPRMKQDVMRLEEMVENMLDVGRFERKTFNLHFQTTNLSTLLDSTLDAIASVPTRVPLEISRDIEADIYVRGDSVALRRALHAVCDNSLKYHNGEKINISVRLHTAGGKAILSIADKGIGLERGELKAIFERFYRVGNELTRTSQGTGLGLYLCREMIHLHSGKIVARSDGLGRGVEFEITLPLEPNRENNSAG